MSHVPPPANERGPARPGEQHQLDLAGISEWRCPPGS